MCNHTVTRCPCQELFVRAFFRGSKKASLATTMSRDRLSPQGFDRAKPRTEAWARKAAWAASPSCLLGVMPMAWISHTAMLPCPHGSGCSWFISKLRKQKQRRPCDRVVCAAVFVPDISESQIGGLKMCHSRRHLYLTVCQCVKCKR